MAGRPPAPAPIVSSRSALTALATAQPGQRAELDAIELVPLGPSAKKSIAKCIARRPGHIGDERGRARYGENYERLQEGARGRDRVGADQDRTAFSAAGRSRPPRASPS